MGSLWESINVQIGTLTPTQLGETRLENENKFLWHTIKHTTHSQSQSSPAVGTRQLRTELRPSLMGMYTYSAYPFLRLYIHTYMFTLARSFPLLSGFPSPFHPLSIATAPSPEKPVRLPWRIRDNWIVLPIHMDAFPKITHFVSL